MTKKEFAAALDSALKAVRKEYGFTQEKMAAVLGISKKTLVEIEKGRSSLGWTGAAAFAAIFRESGILQAQFGGDLDDLVEALAFAEAELENLKTVRRKDVAEKIKEARGQGDLSENAEYDAAKEEQAEIEARIVQLEKMLRNAEVIDEEEGAKDTISLGTTVTVLDVEFDEEMEYTIVGSAEADPMNGRISNESPVGMALLGHKKDDIIMIETPDGEVEFKVLRFTK